MSLPQDDLKALGALLVLPFGNDGGTFAVVAADISVLCQASSVERAGGRGSYMLARILV